MGNDDIRAVAPWLATQPQSNANSADVKIRVAD